MLAVFAVLSGWTALAGVSSPPPEPNVFISSPILRGDLKRVLVLPLACDESDGSLSDGCQMLDPVLHSALTKTAKFEVAVTTPETLRRCTGKLSWTGGEVLPADFFSSLRNVYGCDAVMFCQLTVLRASPPLAVGWRLKLVEVKTGKILWATDEIFDASNLSVAKSAQRFQKREQPHHSVFYGAYSFVAWCLNTPTRSALDDQWNILHSPRFFGEYSLENLLQTLPKR